MALLEGLEGVWAEFGGALLLKHVRGRRNKYGGVGAEHRNNWSTKRASYVVWRSLCGTAVSLGEKRVVLVVCIDAVWGSNCT